MRFFIVIGMVSLILLQPASASDTEKKFERKKFDARSLYSAAQSTGQEAAGSQQSLPYAKSKKKAFLFSLLLPGLGELYQNDWKFNGWGSGLYYFGAEALLWSSHLYLGSYSNWLKEDSRSLAARNAGVDLKSPKPSRYYVNIGKFSDIYTYNEFQRRLVGTSTLYAETNANFWQWNNDGSRRKYDRLRADSDTYNNFSKYMLWGIFTNHVLSAVNSMRLFRNNERWGETRIHFDMIPRTHRQHSYDVKVGFLVKF
ncbi:hypothetical protein F9K33_13525 [bacterium]|nr:MAG: hypothetical protein F9K33_13525 [bacterium]